MVVTLLLCNKSEGQMCTRRDYSIQVADVVSVATKDLFFFQGAEAISDGAYCYWKQR